ncbi:hypothetical protein [Archangium sp.]|uniref:hypothetical protein n=1 Tax=Archangium sp. TaxID=1872627 RepID=UPI002D2C2AD6|nr:hypothetical protein [Archangium sp.]HYO56244.1 hypothetical protein [Archangium sp.]
MMVKKNAVERRLELLHAQWTEFAHLPEARLLRWVVEPDEVRMVEAFLHKEGDERMGECPDLFLHLEEPFDEPARYGYALREALVRMEEESRAGLEEEGLGGWRCPPVKEGERTWSPSWPRAARCGATTKACASIWQWC